MDFDEILKTLKEEYPHGHPDFIPMTLDEIRLHSLKNFDYAAGGDPLGNFERVGIIQSLYPNVDHSHPAVVALDYSLKQFDAAMHMIDQGYEGEVENIETRLRDVTIYSKLARILFYRYPIVAWLAKKKAKREREKAERAG